MKPPQHNAIRTIQANKYVGNKNDERAARIAYEAMPDCVTWNEGYQFMPVLRERMANYRHLSAGLYGGYEINRDAQDCLTSVHRSHTTRGTLVAQVCDGIDGSKVAKNRTFNAVGFTTEQFDRPVGVINVHMNWVQSIKNGRIVDEYVKSCEALNEIIHMVKGLGWIPLVQGDINIRRREAASRQHLTPYDIFKEHHLKPYSHDLDVIVHDPKYMEPVGSHIIRKRLTGADHDWIVRDFVRA